MAIRPIFSPKLDAIGVEEKMIDFKWHPGMSASQKKKSIIELHLVATQVGIKNILEISSKSEIDLGIQLSAFNLLVTTKKHKKKFTVETAFQGSKVFENGGPYQDLLGLDSRAAKKDIRLKESGNLTGFQFFNFNFPLIPRTYFYDWLYINALVQNNSLSKQVLSYDSFSDIEFNPKKSINCQAHSVALYLSLRNQSLLETALKSPQQFLDTCRNHYQSQDRNIAIQRSIL
ncbi:DarT1-associated NADAR antitoxin family protein [Pseudoalteromonas fuliginea]|uniref:DarT1-associated NADAR antitoxin family protein n=1 Tax=Pseudoalteromonas fuliginea TaxID=1872678 RepID=UPI00316F3B40